MEYAFSNMLLDNLNGKLYKTIRQVAFKLQGKILVWALEGGNGDFLRKDLSSLQG